MAGIRVFDKVGDCHFNWEKEIAILRCLVRNNRPEFATTEEGLASALWADGQGYTLPRVCRKCGQGGGLTGNPLQRGVWPHMLADRGQAGPDPHPWVCYIHQMCRYQEWDEEDAAANHPTLNWVRDWKRSQHQCVWVDEDTKTQCPRTVDNTPLNFFQFDHRDPLTKAFHIGFTLRLHAFPFFKDAAIRDEVAKCQMMCKTHHYQHTGQQRRKGEVYAGIVADRESMGVQKAFDKYFTADDLFDMKQVILGSGTRLRALHADHDTIVRAQPSRRRQRACNDDPPAKRPAPDTPPPPGAAPTPQ
jgi:hypothetical protein